MWVYLHIFGNLSVSDMYLLIWFNVTKLTKGASGSEWKLDCNVYQVIRFNNFISGPTRNKKGDDLPVRCRNVSNNIITALSFTA